MTSIFSGKIPNYVEKVCLQLQTAGYKSYVVGGALRDLALHLEPKDYDVATDATPDQIEEVFTRTVPTGKKYGTITVILENGETLEVTAFRKDAEYTDGRRPDYVTYSTNLHDDLARRDFTINSIAYDPIADQVEDPFGGLTDIEKQLLTTVGSASERIREDALRMMRAVRIKAEKGFHMAESLAESIKSCARLLKHVSAERIAEELSRIITSSRPTEGVYDLLELGLLQHILPELHQCAGVEQRQDYHKYDVFGHIAHSLQYSDPDLITRLALLLHDIGKPPTLSIDKIGIKHFYGHEQVSAKMAEPILDRLKFSNQIKNQVLPLVLNHMRNVDSDKSLRRLLSELKTPEQTYRFAQIRFADKMAGRRTRAQVEPMYAALRERIAQVYAAKTPLQVTDLPITGEDVMQKLGIKGGPAVGSILNNLLKMTLDKPELNRYEVMLEMIPEIYAREMAHPPKD